MVATTPLKESTVKDQKTPTLWTCNNNNNNNNNNDNNNNNNNNKDNNKDNNNDDNDNDNNNNNNNKIMIIIFELWFWETMVFSKQVTLREDLNT